MTTSAGSTAGQQGRPEISAAIDAVAAEAGWTGGQRPDPTLLVQGPDRIVLRDESRVVHVPLTEAAAASQRLAEHLLPYLRGHLTPNVPQLEPRTSSRLDYAYAVADYLPGRPLLPSSINERTEQRLADALAQFLAELHAFPAERAQALGGKGMRAWRESLEGLRLRSLRTTRPLLKISERGLVRRWWQDFVADARWAFSPALVHSALTPAHLLTDDEARGLTAVLGWTKAAVTDPALDFATISEHYGSSFAWLVLDAYRRRGAAVDADFLERVRRMAVLMPFLAWERDPAREHKAGAAATSLVERLRAGPILAGV